MPFSLKSLKFRFAVMGICGLGFATPVRALAEPSTLDSGDTAWLLTSTALTMLMIPGIALFYGGMVRTKNALSTMYQSFMALAVVGLAWALIGYSVMYAPDLGGGLAGGFDYLFLNGVGGDPAGDGRTVPHAAFMLFQGMIAALAPAFITGAFAERVRIKAWIPFMALWSVCIYSVVGHWVWGPNGWIAQAGALDFAGGFAVHLTVGFSALGATFAIEPRSDFAQITAQPHNPGLVLLGAGLLMFGWFGLAGGWALEAGGLASVAMSNLFFSAAAATMGWTVVDNLRKGKISPTGSASGCICGLVIMTPAAGGVTTSVALLMGFVGSVVCNWAAVLVKARFKRDDTLHVFACHGIGGLFGLIGVSLFASQPVGPSGNKGLLSGEFSGLVANLQGAAAVAIVSFVGTLILIKIVNVFARFRLDEREEIEGLDVTQHGEVIALVSSQATERASQNNVTKLRSAS